jgi:hypothetical protein
VHVPPRGPPSSWLTHFPRTLSHDGSCETAIASTTRRCVAGSPAWASPKSCRVRSVHGRIRSSSASSSPFGASVSTTSSSSMSGTSVASLTRIWPITIGAARNSHWPRTRLMAGRRLPTRARSWSRRKWAGCITLLRPLALARRAWRTALTMQSQLSLARLRFEAVRVLIYGRWATQMTGADGAAERQDVRRAATQAGAILDPVHRARVGDAGQETGRAAFDRPITREMRRFALITRGCARGRVLQGIYVRVHRR